MIETLVSIVIASLFVSCIALVGVIFLAWKKSLTGREITYLVSFAAGMLLATAFVDLLPEAAESGIEYRSVSLFALMGIVTFFFLERLVLSLHHHHEFEGTKPSAILILVGDTLHNFIDGVAIAATFLTSPTLGFATTLAIAAHEAPHEIADFSILISGGMKRKKALVYNFLSALSALGGAILGFYFLENLEITLPFSLAFTAGMFIYIACADLIPELHSDFRNEKNWILTLPFVLGIAATSVLVRFLEL